MLDATLASITSNQLAAVRGSQLVTKGPNKGLVKIGPGIFVQLNSTYWDASGKLRTATDDGEEAWGRR